MKKNKIDELQDIIDEITAELCRSVYNHKVRELGKKTMFALQQFKATQERLEDSEKLTAKIFYTLDTETYETAGGTSGSVTLESVEKSIDKIQKYIKGNDG